jgi:hypothetical protein
MSVLLGFLVGLLNIKVEPAPEMRSHSLYIRYMHLQVDHIVYSLISYEYLVVVQEPLMPEDKLELVRSQLLGAIARRGDDVHSPCFLFLCIHGFVLIGLFVMNGACTNNHLLAYWCFWFKCRQEALLEESFQNCYTEMRVYMHEYLRQRL